MKHMITHIYTFTRQLADGTWTYVLHVGGCDFVRDNSFTTEAEARSAADAIEMHLNDTPHD